MPTPILIGDAQKAAIADLRARAARAVVDVNGLADRLNDPAEKRRHMRRMTEQTIEIPIGFAVTYSVEIGHPAGLCRHMSMSSPVAGRVPSPGGTWMVARAFGFTGRLADCAVWIEDLQGHGHAVNVVQPIARSELL